MRKRKDETMIIKCTCKSEYQDKVYGLGMRVHNEKKDHGEATCTVCGHINKVKGPATMPKKGDDDEKKGKK